MEDALEQERKARRKCMREKCKLEGELKKNLEDVESLESSRQQLAEQLKKRVPRDSGKILTLGGAVLCFI